MLTFARPLITASIPISHGLMLALGLLWWSECDPVSSVIALCGFALCLASAGFADKLLGLWLHLAVVTHLVFGMRLDYYQHIGPYDELVHLVGMMGLVAILISRNRNHPALRPLLETRPRHLILSLTLALALGAAWELFEFFVDALFALNAQQSLRDTNLDLIAGLLGGFGAFVVTVSPVRRDVLHSNTISTSSGEIHGN